MTLEWTLRDQNGHVLRELESTFSGTTETRRWRRDYIRAPDGRAVALSEAKGSETDDLALHPDHLGSPRIISRGASIVGRATYFPFGESLENGKAGSIGFAGHEEDADTALYNMGARIYNPELGRFLTPDPVADDQWNRYAYVANDPISNLDPDGRRIYAIHGTWANPDGLRMESSFAGSEGAWRDAFRDNSFVSFNWSGDNSHEARVVAAHNLAALIALDVGRKPDMPVNIVGHSHGGNIAILAANILAEQGIEVDGLVTIGTPSRAEYRLDSGASDHFLNLYNSGDLVQIFGGGDISLGNPSLRPFGELGLALREQPGALNRNVDRFVFRDAGPRGRGSASRTFGAVWPHSAMHANPAVIYQAGRILQTPASSVMDRQIGAR